MPNPKEVQQLRKDFAQLTDDELIYKTHQWVAESEQHVAAKQVLHDRQQEGERSRHRQVLRWAVIAAVAGLLALLVQIAQIATTPGQSLQPAPPAPGASAAN